MTMEKTVNMKVAGVASAAILLAGSGAAAVAAPAVAAPVADNAAVAAADSVAAATAAGKSVASPIDGAFLFSQEMTTTNDVVRAVFTKASAVLCSSLPQYSVAASGEPVLVTGPDGSVLGTVDELAADEESTVLVGCACASNTAGGGAIANVGVSGTTLAALIAAVNA